jgi:DNA repair protein RAD57
MTDLLHVLPEFPINKYTHLIPSLEKHLITTSDLLTVEIVSLSRRAKLPILDLKCLAKEVVEHLHIQLGVNDYKETSHSEELPYVTAALKPNTSAGLRSSGLELSEARQSISTLDDSLDEVLGGGIPTGYITEITGERYGRI